jgi:hypothetical protein
MGSGQPAEEAIRDGDTIGYASVASTGQNIGGPNGATILEVVASGGANLTFLATTEVGRYYTIYNPGTAFSVIVPASAGTATSLFQTGASSFSLTSTKTAVVVRLGKIPPVTGSVASDRWIYWLSA